MDKIIGEGIALIATSISFGLFSVGVAIVVASFVWAYNKD